MTVRRGSSWGEPIPVPDDIRIVTSNADLAAALAGGPPFPTIGLRGGDLARTVSASPTIPLVPGASATGATVDLVEVVAGDRRWWAASHVVVRRSWWRGELWCAMNAEFLGTHDVAPRGHPNDGRLDLLHVSADMTLRQRWAARRRLPTGTHLPHPRISTRSVTDWTTVLAPRARLYLDGTRISAPAGTPVAVRCVPDALRVVF